MTRMSEEKRKKYREIYETLSNAQEQPENVRNFIQRMAREKVSVWSTQNLSWMGFYKAPFSNNLEEADIVIVGSGADYGTLSETGDMRHAPSYLRFYSRYIVPIHIGWGIAPFEVCRIIDMGDVDLFGLSYESAIDHISSHLSQIAENGALPLHFGGEHSVSHGTLAAVKKLTEKYFDGAPVGGILLDGHTDLMTATDIGGFTQVERENANFFTRAIADGVIDPEKFIMFGMHEIGCNAVCGMATAEALGVITVTPIQVEEKGVHYWADLARERVGDGPCILSCDLDGLDPAGSGGGLSTRDGLGLTWREYRILSQALRGKNLLSVSVVEYSPAHDLNKSTAYNATALAFEYLCMLAETKVRLNKGEFKQTQWPLNLSTSASYFGGNT